MTHDVIVDTLYEESLIGALKAIGTGRLVMDKNDPEEPFITDDAIGVEAWEGCLVIRVKDQDPHRFARELERRVPQMRIVTVINRTPNAEDPREGPSRPSGSASAQADQGLLETSAQRWQRNRTKE